MNRYINIIQIACVVYTFQNRNYIRILAEIPVTKDGLKPPNKSIQIANLLCCIYHLFLTLIAGFQIPILVKVVHVSDLHLNRMSNLRKLHLTLTNRLGIPGSPLGPQGHAFFAQ